MDLSHPLLASFQDDIPPFPANQPALARHDRALLCQICKEFFQAPVSIQCGHSFCSQCIRGYCEAQPPGTKKVCPTCGEPVEERHIRRNRTLEELADSWEDTRPALVTLTSRPTPAGPSRKRPAPTPYDDNSSTGSVPKKRRGSNGRPESRQPSPSKGSSNGELVVLDSDEIEEVEEPLELSENDDTACPLCQALLPIGQIPGHVERGCPKPKPRPKANAGTGNQKADWRKVFAGVGAVKDKDMEMKRITKPNYTLSKDSELRAFLASYSLPTTGDRDTLVHRVQQWILMFNSNLDSAHPKSASALKAKLNEEEAARRRDVDRGKQELVNQLETKEGKAKYAKETENEFRRLTMDIRDRDKRKRAAERGAGADSAIEVE